VLAGVGFKDDEKGIISVLIPCGGSPSLANNYVKLLYPTQETTNQSKSQAKFLMKVFSY